VRLEQEEKGAISSKKNAKEARITQPDKLSDSEDSDTVYNFRSVLLVSRRFWINNAKHVQYGDYQAAGKLMQAALDEVRLEKEFGGGSATKGAQGDAELEAVLKQAQAEPSDESDAEEPQAGTMKGSQAAVDDLLRQVRLPSQSLFVPTAVSYNNTAIIARMLALV
jgi:hypothetical protein